MSKFISFVKRCITKHRYLQSPHRTGEIIRFGKCSAYRYNHQCLIGETTQFLSVLEKNAFRICVRSLRKIPLSSNIPLKSIFDYNSALNIPFLSYLYNIYKLYLELYILITFLKMN